MSSAMRPNRKDGGFTLIEVLASLVIFSVAIVGLIQLNTQSIRTVNSLEDKMLAGIVADNVIVEARRKELDKGENDGEATAKGKKFIWTQEISDTDLENFYKIEVIVKRQDTDQILIQRTAFRSVSP